VFFHAPAIPDRADGEADVCFAGERALLDARGDLPEGVLGGLEQLLALARSVLGH
jgi:hypothetical protein